MKKILQKTLLLTLCAMLLSASAYATAPDLSEKIDINWLGYYTSDITVSPDTQVEKLLEETFNVNINPITDISKSGFGLYVSSASVLDATFYTVYLDNAANLTDMYSQELIREIPAEWLETYYPTGMQIMKDYLGEEYFASGSHLTDGKVLNVPYARVENNSQSIVVYRKDWLENLKMSEPTTLQEFHDMLYAFTYNDPDGNGVKDTYGIDATTAWLGMTLVHGAYGYAQAQSGGGSFYRMDDGSVVYTSATEQYKEALKTIGQWYQEGIIDPECITDARSDVRTKWANGTVGAMVDSFTWALSRRGPASIVNMAEEVFGENSVDVLGKLTCEEGDGTVYAAVNYLETNVNQALVFTASATDAQVIRVLQILEGLSSNDELYKRVIYGEENEDYTMNGEQVCINSDVSVEYQAKKGLDGTFYGLAVMSPKLTYSTYSQRDLDNLAKAELSPAVYRNTNFSNKTGEAYAQYMEEVKKVEGEFYTDVLLGKKTVDADWDNYLERMNKAGLDKILAEYAQYLNK